MSENAKPEAEQPWYAEGLHFTCTQCGDCCTGAPGYVWLTDDELVAIASHLGQAVAEVRDLYTRKAKGKRTLREKSNGDCVFFDRKKGCTVYPVRPTQCRTWPFWKATSKRPKTGNAPAKPAPAPGRANSSRWKKSPAASRS